MLRSQFRWSIRVLAAGLLVLAFLEGCGSSDSSPPPTVCNTGASANSCCAGTNSATACPAEFPPCPQPTQPTLCTPAPAIASAEKAGTPVDPAIVAADNNFGLSLLNTLLQTRSGNTSISPLSVSLTLQIIYNGAAGTTQQAMAQTLQLGGLSTQQLNSDNAALQAALIDPQVELSIANSLWTNSSRYPVLPAFTQVNVTYYAAALGDLAGAPDNVNAWAATQTNGLITNILPPGNYTNATAAVIAGTVYFKGQWVSAFDPALTAAAAFTLSDGTQTSVQMMNQAGSYAYFQGTNFQAVRLPYGKGRMSMFVVLPQAGTDLGAFVAGINADTVDTWESQLQMSTVRVGLPRFTTSFGASLQDALTSLGMGIAFSERAADFSGIAPSTFLAGVQHATAVEVDESGTTAAAATTGTIGVTVVGPQFTMTMDRPFFYAIRDDKTGELLFVGVLANPNAG